MGETKGGEAKGAMSQLHEKFSQVLLRHYGQSVYDECLCEITLVKATHDLVTFETASPEHRDRIGRLYLASIKKLWQKTVGPVDLVTIKLRPDVSKNLKSHSVRAQTKSYSPQNNSRPFFRDSNSQTANKSLDNKKLTVSSHSGAAQARSQNSTTKQLLQLDDILSPVDVRNSFDNFAVDASNQVAYAAAKSATDQKGSAELIYLYGKSGLGKTHLLHAMALQTKSDKPDAKTAYLAYNNIASGCVNAMLSNNITVLHREFLGCEIVLIDDIHLLVGKEKTQEQILSIIDACLASGCHVAVAGEPAPIKLAETGINRRLSDRLSGGLSVAVMSGGPHLRFDVLKKRLARADVKCTITPEALDFIVRNFTHSMRETIGAMNQLLLVYGNRDIKIDLSLAKTSLRSRLQDGKRVYTLDDLLTVTAEVMGVCEADMKGKARPQPIARARHAFVYCAREVLKESLPRISATLLRDHTTALSSVRRAAALLERDKVFCRQVEQIREKIEL